MQRIYSHSPFRFFFWWCLCPQHTHSLFVKFVAKRDEPIDDMALSDMPLSVDQNEEGQSPAVCVYLLRVFNGGRDGEGEFSYSNNGSSTSRALSITLRGRHVRFVALKDDVRRNRIVCSTEIERIKRVLPPNDGAFVWESFACSTPRLMHLMCFYISDFMFWHWADELVADWLECGVTVWT